MAHNACVNEEGGGRRHPKIHKVEDSVFADPV